MIWGCAQVGKERRNDPNIPVMSGEARRWQSNAGTLRSSSCESGDQTFSFLSQRSIPVYGKERKQISHSLHCYPSSRWWKRNKSNSISRLGLFLIKRIPGILSSIQNPRFQNLLANTWNTKNRLENASNKSMNILKTWRLWEFRKKSENVLVLQRTRINYHWK